MRCVVTVAAAISLLGCGRVGYQRSSGTAAPAVCGNDVVDDGETCDDGNGFSADGCENDCTRSCTDDLGCDDGAPCNGTETCVLERGCQHQTPLADGTSCGDARVCRAGACALASCGNGVVDAEEDCDDGNTLEGDGCDNDCAWSCVDDASCDDGNSCDGIEACGPDHTCLLVPSAVDGTPCDRDAMPSTRDICRAAGCFRSICGDMFVDPSSTPAEQCDDGNLVDGDGCDNDCALSTDAGTPTDGGAPTDAGTATDGGRCSPITSDPSALGDPCSGSFTCPAGYTCQPHTAGTVTTYTCEILCTRPCQCPSGTTCGARCDDTMCWTQCG